MAVKKLRRTRRRGKQRTADRSVKIEEYVSPVIDNFTIYTILIRDWQLPFRLPLGLVKAVYSQH
jgi:hypothetical protein